MTNGGQGSVAYQQVNSPLGMKEAPSAALISLACRLSDILESLLIALSVNNERIVSQVCLQDTSDLLAEALHSESSSCCDASLSAHLSVCPYICPSVRLSAAARSGSSVFVSLRLSG